MRATKCFQSILGPSIARYLALKRALGRRYDLEERILRSIDEFLARASSTRADLTANAFALWCQTLQHLNSTVRRIYMRVVRNYCLYRQRSKPQCFVPNSLLFPKPQQAVQPYIFTKDEIVRLIAAARRLKSIARFPLRSEIFSLAIVLLYQPVEKALFGEILKPPCLD
jgi:integrase